MDKRETSTLDDLQVISSLPFENSSEDKLFLEAISVKRPIAHNVLNVSSSEDMAQYIFKSRKRFNLRLRFA